MNSVPARIPWTHRLCIALCSAISLAWGISLIETLPSAAMGDFRAVYYGARCVIQHRDPYNAAEFLKVYQAENGQFPTDSLQLRVFLRQVPICINLPTSLFLLIPITCLPWGSAQVVWIALIAGSLIFSAILILNLARTHAPRLALFLACVLLADCEVVISDGNLAGLAVGLCVVAVWCFLRNRFIAAGIVCLALSLAIKPHDAGLVWLYFLLAGSVQRKRALWTLSLTAAISLCAVLWVAPVSPHWPSELHANLQAASGTGDLNDPGPHSLSNSTALAVISLQALLSFFRDTPRFYNPAAYLLCGVCLLLWVCHTIRLRASRINPWLALAPLVPLTLLVTYHRSYDAKLLLLLIPACAILWARGGALRWSAAIVTALGILFTNDIPLAIAEVVKENLPAHMPGPLAALATVLCARPAPIALSVLVVFYLWLYCARARACPGVFTTPAPRDAAANTPSPATPRSAATAAQ